MKNCNCCTTYNAPDLMDGGITAARIEEEADDDLLTIARAQRDEARRERDVLRQERDEARESLYLNTRAEQPRPLTPDAITEAQQDRARDAVLALLAEQEPRPLFATVKAGKIARAAIRAALTEPPARPEGAEDIEAWLDGIPESIRLDDEHQRLFANHLAHMGFRVPVTLAEVGLDRPAEHREAP